MCHREEAVIGFLDVTKNVLGRHKSNFDIIYNENLYSVFPFEFVSRYQCKWESTQTVLVGEFKGILRGITTRGMPIDEKKISCFMKNIYFLLTNQAYFFL